MSAASALPHRSDGSGWAGRTSGGNRRPVPYGAIIAAGGAVIMRLTTRLPYLFAAAVTGFLLVAPMLGAGLYDSRAAIWRASRHP